MRGSLAESSDVIVIEKQLDPAISDMINVMEVFKNDKAISKMAFHWHFCCKILILFFLLFCSSVLYAKPVPYDVDIDAPKMIKTLLEQNLDLIRWRGNEQIDGAQLRRLYRNTPDEIRQLVETEGYYSPVIKTEMQKLENGGRRILIHVDPGKPVKVAVVDIEFKGAITTQKSSLKPSIEQLKENWQLPVGSVFRMADWEAAKIALLKQVTRVRYPRAELEDTRAIVNPETDEVTLKVIVNSGNPVKFGPIRIVGLHRYGEDVIMGQRPVKVGSTFRENALLNWQSRIQDSGYFSSVEVTADLESGLEEVPITVTVVENKKKHAAVGIGYSTDMGERISLTYDNLHFLGRDYRLKSSVVLQSRQRTAKADVYLPQRPDGTRDSFGVMYDRSEIEGEDTRVAGANFRRAWGTPRLEKYVSVEYLNEHNRIDGADGQQSQALPVTFGIITRHLNNRLAPTKGYALEAQVGAAVEPVLTDKSFVRGYLKGIRFQPIGEKGDLILRGELGAVVSDGKEGVPSTVLFRTGGDQSVRGYSYQSLGVKEGDAIVGGRYLAVASIEYQYYFIKNWGVAFFVDAGNAGDTIKELDPAIGYGIGGRWRSPAGPIGVDLAYGERTGSFRLHFSLGFTF